MSQESGQTNFETELLEALQGLLTAGRPQEAFALALQSFERLCTPDPDEAEKAAAVLSLMAMLAQRMKQPERARVLLQYNRTLILQTQGPDAPALAQCLSQLADLLRHSLGRPEQAEPLYLESLRIQIRAWGPNHPQTADSYRELGELYFERSEWLGAHDLTRHALGLYHRTYGHSHPEPERTLLQLARILARGDKPLETEKLYRRALVTRTKRYGPKSRQLLEYLYPLAAFYERRKRYELSQTIYRRALALLGPEGNRSAIASCLHALGNSLLKTTHYSEAEDLLERALALREASLGSGHAKVAAVLTSLAELYRHTGRTAAADAASARAARIGG